MRSTTRPLRGRRTFTRLAQSGTRVRRGPMTVVVGDGTPAPLIGFAISRHVGGAVVRNRLRRRLVTLLAEHQLPSNALLLRPQPAAAALSYAQLRSLLADCLASVSRALVAREAG
jgi:ribonuclease P protein component